MLGQLKSYLPVLPRSSIPKWVKSGPFITYLQYNGLYTALSGYPEKTGEMFILHYQLSSVYAAVMELEKAFPRLLCIPLRNEDS